MNKSLIAPCGMNCAICKGYLRQKNKCPGCNFMNAIKPTYCRKCIIKNCQQLKQLDMDFCSPKCPKFPCKRLKDLDKRYKTKYDMSMIDNLQLIQEKGISQFLKQQKNKYRQANKTLCVHDKQYY